MSVRLVFSNGVEETLRALESILRELGGVPFKVTTDNPKCFAIEASRYEPLLNIAFERFAAHYGFIIECLPPGDPQKKGKVERMVAFVRRLFESHGGWQDLNEAQEYLNQKLKLANDRKHGTTKLRPIEEFLTVEAAMLKDLPVLCYEREEYHEGSVRKDGHVRFRGKYYSVEDHYIEQDVFIIGTDEVINIYHKNKLIETHPRIKSPHTSKSTKKHHRKLPEQLMEDHEHYIIRASKIGPFTQEAVIQLLVSGKGYIDTRKIWGILSLDKKFSKEEIESACESAINNQDVGYRSILGFLNSRRKEPRCEARPSATNRFIRQIEEYDRPLSLPFTKAEDTLCH
jgi:hypothetical protein